MTTHELLELASLDALGLLDDDEREAFERAFLAAPPALQAQIRREQARIARADALLPQVEAPPSLRARVLAAVRDAIQAVQSRRAADRPLTILPSRGVNPLWRAAAIGCAAAAIVFGFTTLQIRNEVGRINKMIEANAADAEWVRQYGARYQQVFFDPQTRFVQFDKVAPTAADATDAKAMVMVDREGAALFLARDLPESPNGYALVALNPDGSLGQQILTFDTTRYNERISPADFKPAAGRTLALVRQTRDGFDLANALLRSKNS